MTILRSRRFRRAALLFAALFVFGVVTQLGVGWYQRRAAARADLRATVDDVRQELGYENHWELTRLRQSDLGGRYYIVDASGLIIDVEGFAADLTFRADVTNLQPGIHSVTVPLTNETWRLLVAPVKGGRVALGVSPPEDITGVDGRLQENAKRFGESLERATRVTPSDIDRNLYYAVLDDRGSVRFAIGGIPLRLVEYPKSPIDEVEEVAGRSTLAYAILSVPFVSASGKTVGTITALDELAPQPWFSFSAWLVNISSSLALAFVGTLIGVRYIPYEFRPEELLIEALQKGESPTVEFKESIRWDRWKAPAGRPDDSGKPAEQKGVAEAIAVKTVAGFLNSRQGGTLLIGVTDDRKVVGLDRDYHSLAKPGEGPVGPDKQRDRFQLHLRNLLAAKIGQDVSNLCIGVSIVPRDGKDVCLVHAGCSPTPVYIGGPKAKAFYLRVGASTVELDVEETVAYCRERWPASLLARVLRLTRPT
jgi:hypothetical protein